MSPERASILVTEDVPPILWGLEEHFDLHRLWEADDPADLLTAVGPRVRAVAAGPRAPVDVDLMAALPALEIVAKFGVGYDTIDVAEAARRGVVVTNTAGVPSEEVADFAMGLLLAAVRQIPQAARWLAEGNWGPGTYFPLTGTLRDRTVGVYGLGAIGLAVARRCEGFGLEVAYHGRRRHPEVPYPYHDTLAGLAEAVDVLVVTVAGGADTAGTVDTDVLRALGSEGVLVNVARGSVVDQDALVAALRDGTIHAAGLDVFEGEPDLPEDLVALERVVVTPHAGAGSLHAVLGMCQAVVDNLVSWFSGQGPLNPVAETPWTAG